LLDEPWELRDIGAPKDEVDRGAALKELLFEGLGDAAPHAQYKIGILLLEQGDDPRFGVDFFDGLFPHHARIEEHDIGVGGVVRGEIPRAHEHPGHALGLVLVHLAAPGVDIKALHRYLNYSKGSPPTQALPSLLIKWLVRPWVLHAIIDRKEVDRGGRIDTK
jgi:hypothetical protein